MNTSKVIDSCDLSFESLSYQVKKDKKFILSNVSGHFPAGSLVALMGPSGAGKSTLMNILSGYRQDAHTGIYVNGGPVDAKRRAAISCYITQDIHLNDLLSVRENMRFAADFKLGMAYSLTEKAAIIRELIVSFGLTTARNTRAGQLSGGERKRLAVAMEMISDPSIIYLDEPITGLDITAAQQILQFLKKLSASGKTVVCSVHQVCASQFELFDLAYVLADGQCAYNGPPKELVHFLAERQLPCNIYHNPADFIIELCCGDFGQDKVDFLVDASQNGKMFNWNNLTIDKSSSQASAMANSTDFNYQFRTLIRREFMKIKRNKILTYLRIAGTLFLAVATGLLLWDIGNDARKVFLNYNLTLGCMCNLILCGLMYPVLSFSLEMELVKREVHNKYYSILQYYVTVALLDLPISLFTIISQSLVLYYMSGQPIESFRIIIFLTICLLLGTTMNALGFFFGTLFNLHDAIFFGSVSQIPLLAICGLGLMIPDLPVYVEVISRGLYARHALSGCMVSMLGLDRPPLPCPSDVEYCFYKDSARFLRDVGIDPKEYWLHIYVLAAWLVVVRIATYFTMKYRLSNN